MKWKRYLPRPMRLRRNKRLRRPRQRSILKWIQFPLHFFAHLGSKGFILFYHVRILKIPLSNSIYFLWSPVTSMTVYWLLLFFIFWACNSCTYLYDYPVTRIFCVWVEWYLSLDSLNSFETIILRFTNLDCNQFSEPDSLNLIE